jgi:hypothetical protein
VTTLTVRRRRGGLVLEHPDGSRSWLRTGWTWRRGEVHTGTGVWRVEPTDRVRLGVTAQGTHGTAVRLHPRDSHVPGPGGPADWRPGRHHGELTRDGNRLGVYLPPPFRARIRVEITGGWPETDLVVLTACFAMATRRRRRALMAMAVAGAIGHGPVG